jgi:O-antigen/teichoic acid export membrane protein
LSLAINYLLIPLWGVYGAIFVFNVTVMLTAVSLLALAMKVFPIRIERRLGAIGLSSFPVLCFSVTWRTPLHLLHRDPPHGRFQPGTPLPGKVLR